MRVLHFLDSIDRGGAEAQALDVCRNASRFDIEITLVTAKGGAMEAEFQGTGAGYVRLDRKLPVDLNLASRLRQVILERDIQVVHGYQAVDGLHLYLATRGLKNVKRVLSFQGFIQDKKNRLTSKFLIRRMHANIAVSRGMLKWLADVDHLDTSRNFTVIYNGADPSRVKPSGKSLRAELELPEASLLIGMVGNFYRDPRKDQMTVCRALPEVFAKFPNAHCLFAGRVEPGAEDKMAGCLNICREHGIEDRVHFLGGRSDVPDILAALDVFVFSSLHEGLPLAVSEAMLAGVPMIVSDIEPLLEATGEGKYAEVFPVGNENALARRLVAMLGDDGARRDMSRRAKEFAVNNFSIEAHLRELTRLYRDIARR
ncbi:MAG TPA: glycosyltransferase [Pyrinomonadaceae bacterium]|nr:glycosyltransferase [Pyrinomonadaceae bacterium]